MGISRTLLSRGRSWEIHAEHDLGPSCHPFSRSTDSCQLQNNPLPHENALSPHSTHCQRRVYWIWIVLMDMNEDSMARLPGFKSWSPLLSNKENSGSPLTVLPLSFLTSKVGTGSSWLIGLLWEEGKLVDVKCLVQRKISINVTAIIIILLCEES